MKRSNKSAILVALSVATLLAMLALKAPAQGWETVFTLPPPIGGTADRWPAAILADPFVTPPGSSRLWVGMNPGNEDLLTLDVLLGTLSPHTFTVPGEGVYCVGFDPASQDLYAWSDSSTWKVRKSADAGASWTMVDSPPLGGSGGPGGFAVDAQSNLYVSGTTTSSNGVPTWIVRKSSDHGNTWTTVGQFSNSGARHAAFIPGAAGGLFVVGYRNSGGSALWTVRRTRDGGATWTTVDSFSRFGKSTEARAIARDLQGRIYVAGYSTPDPFQWELRVSQNGGDTWQTISPPNATAQNNGVLNDMAIDLGGNLVLVGTLDAWAVVRRSAEGTWQDVELPFGTEPGWVPSLARAATVDALGNVFVAGVVRSGWPGTITSSMVIQKLAASVLPPLSVKRSANSLVLSWPAALTDAQLESTDTPNPGAPWFPVTNAPVMVGNEQTVTVDSTAPAQFFRLRNP